MIALIQRLYITFVRSDTYMQIDCCDALLVFGDADLGYKFNGKAYAQIMDSLGELIFQSGLTTRSIVGNFSRVRTNTTYSAPATMNRFLLRDALASRLISILFGRTFAKSWRQEHRIKHWKKILKRCKAKAVFSIQPEMALCRAGHELKIRIFDVQHGIISDAEDNQYYQTEKLVARGLTNIPHGFLCWDNASAAVLRPLAMQMGYGVHVIGNPWLARFAAPDADDILVQNELSLFNESKKTIPVILVTLQNNMRKLAPEYISNGVMAKCLEQTIRETCQQYFWYLRLHPSQIRNQDPDGATNYLRNTFGNLPNVDWDVASQAALPALLTTVDLHITHFSAATIEAACLGVRTGLLDLNIEPGRKHQDLFRLERDRGYAEKIPLEVGAITNFIESVLRAEIPGGHTRRSNIEFDKKSILSFLSATSF